MSVDYNDIVKQGYVKLKSRTVGVWQKRWIVLRKPSSKGPRRIEKYTDEKTAKSGISTSKPIDLCNDVRSISLLPDDIKKYAVAVCFTDGTSRQFACDKDAEANEWLKVLSQECLDSTAMLRNVDLLDSLPSQRDINEFYHVYLLPSPNLEIMGECLMQVTSENIHILDITDFSRRLVTWPLNSLRRYGRDETKFTFEAGRYCDTGEGMFVFNTIDGERIYQRVHQATLAIAETHRFTNRQNLRSRSAGQLPSIATLPISTTMPRPALGVARSLPPTPVAANPQPSPLLHSQSFTNGTSVPESPPPLPPGRDAILGTLSPGTQTPAALPRPIAMAGRPLPEPPTPPAKTEDDPEYIYEEKGLDPEFRKFLSRRKEDPS